MDEQATGVTVVPTLSEEACQLALHSRHLGLSLPSQVWLQIENTTIDRSRGNGHARRHPILDPATAQLLRDYYGRSADAFAARGLSGWSARGRGQRRRFVWPGHCHSTPVAALTARASGAVSTSTRHALTF
jgi:hypothetical protein